MNSMPFGLHKTCLPKPPFSRDPLPFQTRSVIEEFKNRWNNTNNTYIYIFFQLLEEVGFSDVKAKDNTARFIEILKAERERFDKERSTFLKVCVDCVVIFQNVDWGSATEVFNLPQPSIFSNVRKRKMKLDKTNENICKGRSTEMAVV